MGLPSSSLAKWMDGIAFQIGNLGALLQERKNAMNQ